MSTRYTDRARGEDGIALILAVLLLLLVSGIGIAAIDHAGEDAAVTGRSRRTSTTFYAADAGVHLTISRLTRFPPDVSAFSLTTPHGTVIRSGPRTATVAQPIQQLGSSAPPDGFAIGVGGGYSVDTYKTEVTAIGPDNATQEVEGKFYSLSAGSGGY
jgi:Tfp pilus assembly protein PilX